MANRLVPIAIAAAIAVLFLGSAAMVLVHAKGAALGAADLAAIRFTLWQAALSAAFSCVLAMPLARALHRRRFRGRGLLIRLLSAPFILPVMVAVMGILALFGRAGVLAAFNLNHFHIFGLQGVVIAHVFLNLPLALRLLLGGWQAIPAERFRLAQTLGLSQAAAFRHLEWPMLRASLPSAFLTIFLICLTSFAVALSLGGGPAASTIELAIYQALRFDFDLGRAALLSLVQMAVCTGAVVMAGLFARETQFGTGLGRAGQFLPTGGIRRVVDIAVICAATAFLAGPLGAVLARGARYAGDMPPSVWPAVGRSFMVAITSATLATFISFILARARAKGAGVWVDIAVMLPLATSGLALGTGWFLAIRPFFAPQDWALYVTILANMLATLPFLYRLLLPAARQIEDDFARLTASLHLSWFAELRFVALPRMARALGFGAGLAGALSMGDLGVIALFSDAASATLPLEIARAMGAYRMNIAAAEAVLLVALSLGLLWFFDALGERYAAVG